MFYHAPDSIPQTLVVYPRIQRDSHANAEYIIKSTGIAYFMEPSASLFVYMFHIILVVVAH